MSKETKNKKVRDIPFPKLTDITILVIANNLKWDDEKIEYLPLPNILGEKIRDLINSRLVNSTDILVKCPRNVGKQRAVAALRTNLELKFRKLKSGQRIHLHTVFK